MLAGEPLIPSHDRLLCLPAAGEGSEAALKRDGKGAVRDAHPSAAKCTDHGSYHSQAQPHVNSGKSPRYAQHTQHKNAAKIICTLKESPSLARGSDRSQKGSYIVNRPLHLWHVMEL